MAANRAVAMWLPASAAVNFVSTSESYIVWGQSSKDFYQFYKNIQEYSSSALMRYIARMVRKGHLLRNKYIIWYMLNTCDPGAASRCSYRDYWCCIDIMKTFDLKNAARGSKFCHFISKLSQIRLKVTVSDELKLTNACYRFIMLHT